MKILSNLLWVFLTFTLFSCSNDKKQAGAAEDAITSASSPKTVQEALKQVDEIVKNQEGKAVPPVNFRELQNFLPENAGSFSRSKLSGETSGAAGISFSKAEATYKNAQGKSIRIDLVDTGGLGMTQMSMAAWASITIDKEDDKGYERTGQMDGYKTFEKYKKSRSDCDFSMLVGNRFVINASGNECAMDDLKQVVRAIDLKKLEGLK